VAPHANFHCNDALHIRAAPAQLHQQGSLQQQLAAQAGLTILQPTPSGVHPVRQARHCWPSGEHWVHMVSRETRQGGALHQAGGGLLRARQAGAAGRGQEAGRDMTLSQEPESTQSALLCADCHATCKQIVSRGMRREAGPVHSGWCSEGQGQEALS